MKTFKIPVTWESYGYVNIEADTVEEALKIAKIVEYKEGLPLPTEYEYVDGSFEIEEDIELITFLNK